MQRLFTKEKKSITRQTSQQRSRFFLWFFTILLVVLIPIVKPLTIANAQEDPAPVVKEDAGEAVKAAEKAGRERATEPNGGAKADAKADRAVLDAQTNNEARTNSSTGKGTQEKAGLWDSIMNAPETLVRTALQWVSQSALTVVSYLVSWSGLLLNIVLQKTVVDMKKTVDTLTVIDTTWKVVRDFINMLFLFGLLYAAVSHIIDVGKGRDLRNVVIHIIVGAVFMNFSMVMTKALIDASNIVTIGLYEQLPGVSINDAESSYGLSNSIMQALKLQTVFEPGIKPGGSDVEAAVASSIADLGIFLITTIMGSVLMLVTVLLFVTASALFIVRFIVLLFLITLSPVAFAGWALPFAEVKKQSDRWWKMLMQHLTFPITYMLLLWISFKLLVGDCTNAATSTCSNNITSAMGIDGVTFIESFTDLGVKTIGIGLNYAIVIGFMFFSLATAVEASIPGAKWGQGKITDLLNGTRSIAGRNTMGRAATAIQNSRAMKSLQSVAPGIGNKLYDIAGKAADSKYGGAKSYGMAVKDSADRAAQGYKQASTARPLSRRMGESEDSFKARKEEEERIAIERGKRYADAAMGKTLLGSTRLANGANWLGGTSGAEESVRAAVKKATKDTKSEERKAANKFALKDALTEQNPAIRAAKVREVINKMNTTEITSVDSDILKKREVIASLKDTHFEAIEKADAATFSEEDKQEIRRLRYAEFTNAVAAAGAPGARSTSDAVNNMSDATLQGINIDALTALQRKALFAIDSMSSSRFLTFLKSPNLKPAEKKVIKEYRYDPVTPSKGAPIYNAANMPALINAMNDEEIASLDEATVSHPDIVPHLTRGSLAKMLEKNVNVSTRRTIKGIIDNLYQNGAAGANQQNIDGLYAWLASPAGTLFT